jgi:hypothetical protein
MRIPSEQNVPHTGGGEKIILLNPEYVFTQVTATGRNTGSIMALARPILTANNLDDFEDEDFEVITDGEIDLADDPSKRTFTIENKKMTAIKMVDAGSGNVNFLVRQWGRG